MRPIRDEIDAARPEADRRVAARARECRSPPAAARPPRPSSWARSRSSSPAAARSWSTRRPAQLGHVGVAISFGLVIMAMIYAVGHVSGAHFNRRGHASPSRSRATSRGRARSPTGRAQLAGALAAAARPARLARKHRRTSGRRSRPARRAVVPLGAGADRVPDVRDHGRRHRHARSRRGGGDRGRRRRSASTPCSAARSPGRR